MDSPLVKRDPGSVHDRAMMLITRDIFRDNSTAFVKLQQQDCIFVGIKFLSCSEGGGVPGDFRDSQLSYLTMKEINSHATGIDPQLDWNLGRFVPARHWLDGRLNLSIDTEETLAHVIDASDVCPLA